MNSQNILSNSTDTIKEKNNFSLNNWKNLYKTQVCCFDDHWKKKSQKKCPWDFSLKIQYLRLWCSWKKKTKFSRIKFLLYYFNILGNYVCNIGNNYSIFFADLMVLEIYSSMSTLVHFQGLSLSCVKSIFSGILLDCPFWSNQIRKSYFKCCSPLNPN